MPCRAVVCPRASLNPTVALPLKVGRWAWRLPAPSSPPSCHTRPLPHPFTHRGFALGGGRKPVSERKPVLLPNPSVPEGGTEGVCLRVAGLLPGYDSCLGSPAALSRCGPTLSHRALSSPRVRPHEDSRPALCGWCREAGRHKGCSYPHVASLDGLVPVWEGGLAFSRLPLPSH